MAFDEPYASRDVVIGRERVDSRAVFGQTMGLVALTVGFAALGAYLGRDLSSTAGFILFIAAFACIFGLNVAVRRSEQVAMALLFALGLLLGMATGSIFAYYAENEPTVLWQSVGATALFVGGLGAYGYATRRDLSHWARFLFWSLLALIVFGVILIFVNIPGGSLVYALLGLGIFGAYTIFDFNRLRRAEMGSAIPIAASIFLDIFNVLLLMLSLFGGSRH